ADRDSERVHTRRANVSSIRRKDLQYRALIEKGAYKDHFDVKKTPMVALFVTTNPYHMEQMVKEAADVSCGANTYLWHTNLPQFGRWMKVPPPMLDLLTRPYKR